MKTNPRRRRRSYLRSSFILGLAMFGLTLSLPAAGPAQHETPPEKSSPAGEAEKGARVVLDRFFGLEPAAKPKPEPEPEPEPEPSLELASKLELGASGSEGNTNKFEGRLAFETVAKSKGFIFKYDLSYFYGEVEQIKSTNQLSTGAINDWRLPQTRFLIFGLIRYDYNEFESWEQRLAGHGGLACYLAEMKNFELLLRAGAGAAQEFGGEEEKLKKEGILGIELAWLVAPGQKLSASHYYYPDLDRNQEFRMTSQVRFEARINSGLALNLGAQNDHQSHVEPGFERNDFKYYTALLLSF